MVAVKYDDLFDAFAFVGSALPGEHSAYLSLDTGRIYWTSELNPIEEDVPDDLETSARYLSIPHKTELDLGRNLALRFAASEMPEYPDQIAGLFGRKGAYARFKDLLDSEGALERWYRYEADATEQALRGWCADNGIRIVKSSGESTAPPADGPAGDR